MPHYDYNMVAIGAGAAGLVTAYICAATKGKVALVEKHKMGEIVSTRVVFPVRLSFDLLNL
jgi:pyruvate/2-oxoglutarate dehydrogenase complex dihydrolipoamide dehydrogenase (E3) component